MADAARAARAAALEEKKRRLEEIKARRTRRSGDDGAVAAAKATSKQNLDEYIDGLLKTPVVQTSSLESKEPPPTSQVETSKVKDVAVIRKSKDESNKVIAQAVSPPAAPPVKKVETFEIGTQTDTEDFPAIEAEEEEEQAEEIEKTATAELEPTDDAPKEEDVFEPKVLSEKEREETVISAPFSSFLNTASKKVERVLGANVLADLLVDFVGETDGADATEKTTDGSKFVSSQEIFESAKWTGTRDVTDMDWSPLHRELMLSSYHMPSSSTSSIGSAALTAISPDDTPSSSLAPRSGELQSDGLALVWNLAMPTRPEHIFTCGSPVLSARFHPSESALVLGACQSGQLVVWDVRAGRLPVQRSSQGHAYPICGLEISERGSGLVSADTDGKIAFWSIGNLRDPVESLQIEGNIASLAVAPESDTIVCGDECGTLFAVAPSTTSGQSVGGAPRSSKRPVRKLAEGHFGMVTSVSTKKVADNRAGMAKGFLRGSGGMILTSGVDWTIQLWAPAYVDKPLLNFVSHSYDYMCDVNWNPSHPSLFATASSNGRIGLWNLATSLDESQGEIVVEKETGRGLNKLKWSMDGRRLLVASGDRVYVLSISEEVVRQKGDENERMMRQLINRGLLERA